MQPPCDLLVPRSENMPDPTRHPQSFVRDRLDKALARARKAESAAARRRLDSVNRLHEIVDRQIRNDVRRQVIPVRGQEEIQCAPRGLSFVGPACLLGALLLIFVVTLVRVVFRR